MGAQGGDLASSVAQVSFALDDALRDPGGDALELGDPSRSPLERLAAGGQLELQLADLSATCGPLGGRRGEPGFAQRDRLVDLTRAVSEQGPLEATLADSPRLGAPPDGKEVCQALSRSRVGSSSRRGASPHRTSIR